MWKAQDHGKVKVIAENEMLSDNAALERALVELEREIAKQPSAPWIVDGSCINIINSDAVAIFIRIVRQVNVGNGRIALVNINQFVSGVMQSLRISKVFPIFATAEQAIAEFSKGR